MCNGSVPHDGISDGVDVYFAVVRQMNEDVHGWERRGWLWWEWKLIVSKGRREKEGGVRGWERGERRGGWEESEGKSESG